MLPTNVMSFMKKMVGPAASPDSSGVSSTYHSDISSSEGTALSKLRQTLSSGLMTAQDRVTKFTPSARHAAAAAASVAATAEAAAAQEETNKTAANNINNNNTKSNEVKPICRTGACRVCLKSFKPEEFFRLCGECQQRVCEDCASYSKLDENQDQSTWRCSICRRRAQSRAQPVTQQDSTDSLLEIPVLEALQRRHSDVKISGSNAINLTPGTASSSSGTGLAPPRTPELRRHSDVSPASLKELEKVAGERREELRWERELEFRQYGKSRSSSPTVERRPLPGEQQQPHRSLPVKPEKTPTVASPTENPEESEERRHTRNRNTIRRKSRAVQRQHSYDEEIKNSKGGGGGAGPATAAAPSEAVVLGLPAALPRRASAYDVYAPRVDSVGGGIPITGISLDTGEITSTKRRSSFRVTTDGPTQQDGSTFEPPSAVSVAVVDKSTPPSLAVDELPRTRRRGSQLPDLAAVRALAAAAASSSSSSIQPQQSSPPAAISQPQQEVPPSGMRRQTSVQDGEAIKIVIQDVDSDTSFRSRPGAKRRVVLRRDPADKAHRTRGFGMRVVGGKTGADGRLFAYIVWTVPGGPAEKGGLQQGDKVLEWDGVPLVDRSFEEVCAVMDRTGDVAELLVEHATDLRMCDLLDEAPSQAVSRKNSDVHIQLEGDMDKTPTSPTRRKLPKTPGQSACKDISPLVNTAPEVIAPVNNPSASGNAHSNPPVERGPVTGRVQLQVFYNDDRHELVASVMAADELACHEDVGMGTLPEAYVKLRLLPSMGDRPSLKSDVAEPTHNPIWNATLTFPNVPGEELMDKTLEVTLWDYNPDRDPIFLGECTIEMKKAILTEHEVWYRLEDPRCLRQGGKSPHASPRGSLATELAQRLIRRQQDWQNQRSWSDDRDSIDGESLGAGSPDAGSLLHPDHAWRCDSRRGSSQSEIVDVEPYNLGKDFSRSLPGSRRSSVQQPQQQEQQQPEKEQPIPTYHRERRRSSCSHRLRDPEEILRSLKAVKDLGRTLSFAGDKRVQRRHKDGRKNSVMELSLSGGDADENDEEAWREDEIELGPGQIHPRGYRLAADRHGELRLGLIITKGQLEVDVQEGRTIHSTESDNPPDTYVKTYLREGERWMQKRKTRVARRSVQPQFRQTLRYQACDVLGRTLLVMLWEKQKRFEHNQGLGGAEIALDKLHLSQQSLGWYPLYPIESLGSDSDSN